MRRSSVLTVLALVVLAFAAPAPHAAEPEADADALVRKLGDADWKAREKAADQLTRLGDQAESPLRKRLVEVKDPEERSRVEGLLGAIERSRQNGPSLVTLRKTAATPKEVFAEIANQTGVEFAPGTDNLVQGVSAQSIDVDFDHVPLWQALLDVSRTCGLSFHSIDEKKKVALEAVNDALSAPPAATAGPFLVTLNHIEINFSKGRAFAGRRPNNVENNRFQKPACRMYLYAWGEPRLQPLLWFIDSVDECVTEGGNPGGAAPGGRMSRASGQVNSPNETQFSLDLPRDAGGSIKRLKMTGRFVLGKGTQTLEIPNILSVRDANYVLGGFRLKVVQVNKVVDGQYAYEMVAYRDGKPQADWDAFRMLVDRRGCRLVDAEGTALNFRGGGGSYGPDEFRITQSLTCEARGGKIAGEPVKLVWEFPTEVQQVRVSLEFCDIPLP